MDPDLAVPRGSGRYYGNGQERPVAGQLTGCKGEVTKLKVEKLELLRQNAAPPSEVKHLRERELQLQCDLSTASREINKLPLQPQAEAGQGAAVARPPPVIARHRPKDSAVGGQNTDCLSS